ncbi:MAG: DMT family transporter [Bacteriovorax sp.]|nr:DMT family transporter [Rhizobacter sp.]
MPWPSGRHSRSSARLADPHLGTGLHPRQPRSPALRGGLIALLAAVLFGISTPLVQRFGAGLGSFTTAALLYAGAALVGALLRRPVEQEARVRRGDAKRLALMALFGAGIGPVALAWGLQHTSGASASLMLTLEAVFTAVLARLWYHEALDRRVMLAMVLLTLGGMALVLDGAAAGAVPLLGLLAVMGATAAWGVDNTLSRAVAERDPGQVVMFKGALGAVATLLLAVAFGEPVPALWPALALLAVGATGYGLSLRFYLLAQRAFGAARTGSVFAFAPFVGALLAFMLGERMGSVWMVAGAALMVAGILLHLAERHAHGHQHDALEHEHAHHHNDAHHVHQHTPMPAGAHSHAHLHEPTQHAHPHVPDEHHGHRH